MNAPHSTRARRHRPRDRRAPRSSTLSGTLSTFASSPIAPSRRDGSSRTLSCFAVGFRRRSTRKMPVSLNQQTTTETCTRTRSVRSATTRRSPRGSRRGGEPRAWRRAGPACLLLTPQWGGLRRSLAGSVGRSYSRTKGRDARASDRVTPIVAPTRVMPLPQGRGPRGPAHLACQAPGM